MAIRAQGRLADVGNTWNFTSGIKQSKLLLKSVTNAERTANHHVISMLPVLKISSLLF